MIEIDALLTTGEPALVDLHGASPTGGQVGDEARDADRLRPGDVIWSDTGWVVVADVRHNGIMGVTSLAAFTRDGDLIQQTYTGDSAMVRTDTRINAGSLWKLADRLPQPAEPVSPLVEAARHAVALGEPV